MSSPYTTDLYSHSATYLAEAFRTGRLSIENYLGGLFAHIEGSNSHLGALTSIQKERALAQARDIGARGPTAKDLLFGVPVIIKENIQKKGFPVECASRILKGYKGQFDAAVVEALEAAGAILIATANMDEFAMGSSNEHSVHGPVKNPHDLSRVSGGSSGGSAAAVAAGYAPLALGSDTGGSVRQPAAYCGVYGFKPTYGRVSRYGLVAYGSSLDQISPFARSTSDLDLIMKVIGRHDSRDATSFAGEYESKIQGDYSFEGKKIGILRSLFDSGIDAQVHERCKIFETAIKERGAVCIDVEIPSLTHALSVYYLIASAEASSNLARFDGIRFGRRAQDVDDISALYCKSRSEGFGAEVKLRIMLGTFALSAGYYDAYYGRAQAVRALIVKEFESVFRQCDVLFLPTAPTSAFKLGVKVSDPVQMYLNDVFTIPANLAGLCALSAPACVSPGSLPVGLQFLGARGTDSSLLAFVNALENANLVGPTPLP